MAIGTGAAILGGAALGLLNGSKKSGDMTQTTTPNPAMQDVYANASNIYSNPVYNYAGPKLAPGATQNLQATIRGDYLTPDSNPFMSQYVNDALGQAKTAFAGQYGGQAGGNLGNSGYQEMLMRTLANTALPIYSNAYNMERQNQLQASQMAQGVDTGNVQAPFAEVQAFRNAVDGPGGTSSQPYFSNPLGGALGGAMAGGQLFNMMGNTQAAPSVPYQSSTPYGAGFGWGNT
jgi:hypothetical protein